MWLQGQYSFWCAHLKVRNVGEKEKRKMGIKEWMKRRVLIVLVVLNIFSARLFGFSFVVLGDNRPGAPGLPQPKVFKRIIDEINLLRPCFVIHTGDFVCVPTEKSFLEFLKVICKLKVPFYPVMGNHDRNLKLYNKLFKKPLYYSFRYENALFIILNPYVEKEPKIDDGQFKWLVEKLREGKDCDFIFVFIHEPLYPVAEHRGSSLDRHPTNRDKLAEILSQYKSKVIIFCGHEHLFNKRMVKGLTQIITGGAGAPLRVSPQKGGFYHYLYVSVEGKKLNIAVIKPGSIAAPESFRQLHSFSHRELIKLLSKNLPCYKVNKQILIDGNLKDWNGIKPILLSKDYIALTDLSALIYLAWDERTFYFAAKVRDNILKNLNTGFDIWKGDCIQIAFDTLNDAKSAGYDKNDYEYGFALTAKGVQVYCWAGNGRGLRKDIKLAVRRRDGYTYYESAIPIEALSPLKLKAGSTFGFNVVVLDDDSGKGIEGCIELTPGIIGGKNPSLFKDVVLVK